MKNDLHSNRACKLRAVTAPYRLNRNETIILNRSY